MTNNTLPSLLGTLVAKALVEREAWLLAKASPVLTKNYAFALGKVNAIETVLWSENQNVPEELVSKIKVLSSDFSVAWA